MSNNKRIVITGIGLTSPIGNNIKEFRKSLIEKRSGIRKFETRYMKDIIAGVCDFDAKKYQKRKEIRRGTRAGSISIYCANEALNNANIDVSKEDRSRIGVYVGTTEHGNVETENEIYSLSQYDYDTSFWSHHHNPRTVANNPAGEVTLNLGITGPHYCIGAACAAGNIGVVQGCQMIQLDEIDIAVCGGVSESIHTFGIFAAFKNQGALAFNEDPEKASRPFDKNRNGIVVSEGGCLFVLETLERAKARNAKIYGEIVGHASNSDATDFVNPNSERQSQCMRKALKKANLNPEDIDIVNAHATSTPIGDIVESNAIASVFGNSENTYVNNTKGFIGHAMGAAGSLELAGNLPSFEDNIIHSCMNIDELDTECKIKNLVVDKPIKKDNIKYILNSSFGMLGINSVIIIKKYEE